jgi:hypothetical protein
VYRGPSPTSGTATVITHVQTPFDPGYNPAVVDPASNNLYGLIAFGGAGHGYLLTPITPYDDSNAAITYSSGWSRVTRSGAYGGAVKAASKVGATAQLSFTGKAVSIIGPTGSGLGTANVYIDGTRVATITENKPAASRQRLYTRIFTSRGAHAIRLVVASGTFDLDAFTVAPH